MNITRIYGRVSERRGEGNARIEVLAYRSPGAVHQQPAEMKQNFPPVGYVFAPSIFDRMADVQIGSLLEFNTTPNLNGNGDANLLDFNKEPKLISLRVLEISQPIFSAENALNQPALKEYIFEDLPHFYISQPPWLYGPFKTQGKEIIPKSGMSVKKSPLPEIHTVGSKRYILFEPQRQTDADVDCMTPAQLGNYLKELLKINKISTEIGPLKKALEVLPLDQLGIARLQRIASGLDKLLLNLADLSELAGLSDGLRKMYENALISAREELKSEYLDEVAEEKIIIEKQLNQTKQALQKIKKDKDKYDKDLQQLKREHAHLSTENERILLDIRIGSQLELASNSNASRLATWEEQLYESDGPAFADLSAFIEFLASSWPHELRSERMPSLYFLYQFKDYRCLMAKKLAAVLPILRLTNNCRIVIQQVEADWLKFDRLYKNSLQYIWEAAYQHPSLNHFLVLEDINLAGIECYGKPLLDMLEGIRFKLPGCETGWPDNLWIVASFLPADTERGLGLPLSKTTFSNWGYIPFDSAILATQQPNEHRKLLWESLISHDKIAPLTTNPHLSQ